MVGREAGRPQARAVEHDHLARRDGANQVAGGVGDGGKLQVQQANRVVAGIGNVHVAIGIHGDSGWPVERRAGRRAPVAGVADRAIAGDGRNRPVPVNLAHAGAGVREEYVTPAVHRNPGRVTQLRLAGCAAIARIARHAVAGNRGDVAGRRYHADPIVQRVRDVKIAGGIHGHSLRIVQLSAQRRAAIARVALQPIAGDGRYRSVSDLAYRAIVGVGDVQVAFRIDRQPHWRVQARAGGRAAIARVARSSATGDGVDGGAGHFAHPRIARVGYINVAGAIHRHALRAVELRAGGRAGIAAESRCSVARESRDGAARAHLAHHVIAGVGDVIVAGAVRGDGVRRVHLRAGGRAAIAGVAVAAVAGEGADVAARLGHADAVVQRIGDVDMTRPVDRHAGRTVELGCGRGGAVSAEAQRTVAHNRVDVDVSLDRADLADAAIGRLRDVYVPRRIHGYRERLDQAACVRQTSVARIADGTSLAGVGVGAGAGNVAGSGDEIDDAGAGGDLADGGVTGIGDVYVVGAIHENVFRLEQDRTRCRQGIAAEAAKTVARYGIDDAVGANLADRVVAGIGNVNISRVIHRHAAGQVQVRRSG